MPLRLRTTALCMRRPPYTHKLRPGIYSIHRRPCVPFVCNLIASDCIWIRLHRTTSDCIWTPCHFQMNCRVCECSLALRQSARNGPPAAQLPIHQTQCYRCNATPAMVTPAMLRPLALRTPYTHTIPKCTWHRAFALNRNTLETIRRPLGIHSASTRHPFGIHCNHS